MQRTVRETSSHPAASAALRRSASLAALPRTRWREAGPAAHALMQDELQLSGHPARVCILPCAAAGAALGGPGGRGKTRRAVQHALPPRLTQDRHSSASAAGRTPPTGGGVLGEFCAAECSQAHGPDVPAAAAATHRQQRPTSKRSQASASASRSAWRCAQQTSASARRRCSSPIASGESPSHPQPATSTAREAAGEG